MMKSFLLALLLLLGLCPAALAQQQSPARPTAAPAPPAASPGSPSSAAPAPSTAAPSPSSAAPSPSAAAPAPSAAAPSPSAAAPSPSAAAPPAAPSAARIAPHKWDVDRVRCADLLRASDEDRASAAMFYYGYLAAKAGIHVIDVSHVSGNIAAVMRLCEARPKLTVPQAFRDALGRHRRR